MYILQWRSCKCSIRKCSLIRCTRNFTTDPADDSNVRTQLDKSALELVVGAVMAPVHKYLSYNVIPYVDGCIVHESLLGNVTTPDVIVQQSAPEQAALILSKGMKMMSKDKDVKYFFILET